MSKPARRSDRSPRWWFWQQDDGDVAPTVLLVGLTLFLVLFTIQVGLTFHARTVVNAAAQDAVRAAQLENATVADGEVAAAEILAGSTGLLSDIDISSERTPATVTVTITADVLSLVPFWNGTTSGAASGPRETFRPEADR